MHVGSRFCNGATAYFTHVQWLTKAAAVGDHNRQHLTLLLGGVWGTHLCYWELQSLAPPWLPCACLGWRGDGAAQDVVVGLVLGATLGHEPRSPDFVQGRALTLSRAET